MKLITLNVLKAYLKFWQLDLTIEHMSMYYTFRAHGHIYNNPSYVIWEINDTISFFSYSYLSSADGAFIRPTGSFTIFIMIILSVQ